MPVPKGGSSCAKCEYLQDDKKRCKSAGFIAWDGAKANPPKPKGSDVIPAPIDSYCSNWFDWTARPGRSET